MGYDRHVDYETRHSEDAVEISSNESSDSEVQVLDDIEVSSDGGRQQCSRQRQTTEALAESLASPNLAENALIVESDSDNSEVLFVLALKPPEQREWNICYPKPSDSNISML